ncbi:hypothetical protein NSU_2855 [Novosphingobium pentaromativorans US6-1]|uniref:Uncharacterized protein n=1 Tax=Novosphingobium pentaromativorans US6-1 TaxID=1088721 RepID=G6EET4_9SPHN|nr:hypothetical protein NSU_2855 [Novosphingobium pentaromativorans US6-1]
MHSLGRGVTGKPPMRKKRKVFTGDAQLLVHAQRGVNRGASGR